MKAKKKPRSKRVASDDGLCPEPCPFCGSTPKVLPTNPTIDGNAWGAVQCCNGRCPAKPIVLDGALSSDDRGSIEYRNCAIRRWNRRHNAK